MEAVAAVEDEQRYVWARERAARDLNEATNTSVARWSLLELATMIAVGLAQAWAMKNYFETKVRVVGVGGWVGGCAVDARRVRKRRGGRRRRRRCRAFHPPLPLRPQNRY